MSSRQSSRQSSPSSSYYIGNLFNSPRRSGTDSSHYSCSNLPDDSPARYIRAAEARRQIAEAPDKKIRLPAKNSPRGKLAEYPSTFVNREKLAPLQSKSPWQEYPVLATGSWDPMTGKSGAGPARGVYNKSDRSKFDIIYHDPTRHANHNAGGSGWSGDFSLATYRPRRHWF
ncbi:hypothetical protein V8F20_010328 [Naviculisporaceae sp. PSN 640]